MYGPFFDPRLKTEGIYKSRSVRPSVHSSVRSSQHISKTATIIFLKFDMKLETSRGSNVTRPLFLIFDTITPKVFILLQKKHVFLGFWDFSTLFSILLRNETKILKNGRVTFEPLLSPNFIPNFGKSLEWFFIYTITYARIRTMGLIPGTKYKLI